MYVCVCNAVTEREVEHAIDGGAITVQQLRDILRVTASCGTCQDHIEACLEKKISAQIESADIALL